MARATGKPVREYMPPMGNQPEWATRYLERNGVVGYYTTANMGGMPTRLYSNGKFDKSTIWSFPVLPLGKDACLRDFGKNNIPPADVTKWLEKVTRFVAQNQSARLIYFHPSDVVIFPEYLSSLKSMLTVSNDLHQKGQFQWYTMAQLADFLTKRRQVDWVVQSKDGIMTLKAKHPETLRSFTWFIKKGMCQKPRVVAGLAQIREDRTDWIITAGDEKSLVLQCHFWAKEH